MLPSGEGWGFSFQAATATSSGIETGTPRVVGPRPLLGHLGQEAGKKVTEQSPHCMGELRLEGSVALGGRSGPWQNVI